MATFKLIKAEEAAELLGVAKPTIYSWVRRGVIPYVQIERCVRFDPKELEEWVGERRIPPRKGTFTEYTEPPAQASF